MSNQTVPHFQNDAGYSTILIGSKEFKCIGAIPPFDHPHIFLDMGEDTQMICPYCSTVYQFDESVGAGHATPADCEWSE